MDGLREIQSRHTIIKDVRGRGLLIGLELANQQVTERFVDHAYERGVIMGWTINAEAVVRLAPPLVITQGQIEEALQILEESVAAAEAG
jgi:4-aminobutyrate aminotransferase-like enzyme